MYRRLSVLSGVAILAVVLNHTGGWGITAMVWWAHRFRPVQSPNFDWVGSLSYYISDFFHVLTAFPVPAFLFISGYFIAYAARSSKTGLSWKPVRARIITLLIPYLIWSAVSLLQDYILRVPHTLGDVLLGLFLLGVNGGFYYILVLTIFYLLSPWMVNQVRKNWKALIIGAAVIQVIPILFRYLQLFRVAVPGLDILLAWTPDQIFIRWAIFFPLGIVFGLNQEAAKEWLFCNRRLLLGLTVLIFALMFVETQVIYMNTPDHWRPGPSSIFFPLYGLGVILTFLAYEQVPIPLARNLTQLGGKSYGMYLTHFTFITIIAKLIYHFLPWLLSQQILLQPLLFAVGLVSPLVLMALVARSPLRKAYSYLFG